MSLKFFCPRCGETILVRFLNPGDIAKCRACGSEVEVPKAAVETADRPHPEDRPPDLPKRIKEFGPLPWLCLRTFTDIEMPISADFFCIGELYVLETGLVCSMTQRLPCRTRKGHSTEGLLDAAVYFHIPPDTREDARRRAAEIRKEEHGMSVISRILSRDHDDRVVLLPRGYVRGVRQHTKAQGVRVEFEAPVAPDAPPGRFELNLGYEDPAELAAYLEQWLKGNAPQWSDPEGVNADTKKPRVHGRYRKLYLPKDRDLPFEFP